MLAFKCLYNLWDQFRIADLIGDHSSWKTSQLKAVKRYTYHFFFLLWLPYTWYIFESSITGGAYFRDFHLIWLKVREEHVYEITFHIKPNTMTERLKRKNNLYKKGRMKMYEIW